MKVISESIFRDTKVFAIRKGLRMKMFGTWMKLNFAQAMEGHIRL